MKKEYADLRVKALAIPEQAAAEGRQLTEEEQGQLTSLVEQAKAKHAQIEAPAQSWAQPGGAGSHHPGKASTARATARA
jgi:hypothetical protein